MKFRMIDGHIYSGRSYRAVVVGMAGDKLRRARNLQSYRTSVARRVTEAFDAPVDDSSDASFIQSMERAGLMERIR